MSLHSPPPKDRHLTKEGTTRYLVWGHNDKPVIFYNRVGTSTPTVFTHYFYNAAGDRVKKLTRKGQKLEVTVYVDGGIFELTYTKPTGGSIDVNLYYNTLYLKDGNSAIVSIQVGSNTPDLTPPIKYHIEDHLGNCTVQLNDNGNLVRREEFYPFVETAFGSYAFKRYRFNGKEKDATERQKNVRWTFLAKGRDCRAAGLYNYGQRYYAPWLCRFVSVDPIAEDYHYLSPYNYSGNQPESSSDIEGLQGENNKPDSSILEGSNTVCPSCQDPSIMKVGDIEVHSTENYTIEYQIEEENGIKYWGIKDSFIDIDNLKTLPADEVKQVLAEYFDKTAYVKVQEAYEDSFSGRAKVLVPFNGLHMIYEIDKNHPTVSEFVADLLHPLPSETTVRWAISSEGYIHIPDGMVMIKAGLGTIPKMLNKGKPMWKIVREGDIFKVGTPLQKMLANYWKKGAQIGDGSSAAKLLDEVNKGQQLDHLQKVIGYRKSFMNALRGRPNSSGVSYGKLSQIQKEVLIRELQNMQDVLTKITGL